jgi:hypothetical protein
MRDARKIQIIFIFLRIVDRKFRHYFQEYDITVEKTVCRTIVFQPRANHLKTEEIETVKYLDN